MTVKRLLQVFPRNYRICITTEYGINLYKGRIWLLDNQYVLSSLVVDLYRQNFYLIVVVAD